MMKNYRVHVNNVVSTVREFIRELRNSYSSYQEIPINQYQIYFIGFTSIVIDFLLKNRTPYTVPPHQLLIWNVRDGWEPLCAFLGKPIPDKPFPFENATGDKTKKNEFIEKYVFESAVMIEAQKTFKLNCLVFIICPSLLTVAGVSYLYLKTK